LLQSPFKTIISKSKPGLKENFNDLSEAFQFFLKAELMMNQN